MVLACAGSCLRPQQERGVYRTVDGGKNWERVLFVDENTGCSELDMDPANPRRLFAGMWHVDIKTWARESGGPGSGLFTSNDGGSTWTRLRGQGLPTREVGKVKVAIAPSNPDRVYAMIETGDGIPWKGRETDRGQVWRSEDGGRTWRVVSYDRNAMGRAHYYSHIFVSPDNENETYFLTANYAVSLDGAQTLASGGACGLAATITICGSTPTAEATAIVGHDQGFSISQNRGKTGIATGWRTRRCITSRRQPRSYYVCNKQDGPSYRGPSSSRLGGFGGSGAIRAACGTRWPAARRVGHSRSGRSEPDLVERLRPAASAASSRSTRRTAARPAEAGRRANGVPAIAIASTDDACDVAARSATRCMSTASMH